MSLSAEGTVTSKGQVTIPKRIRDELGLSAGTKVEFVLDEDGTIRVRPKEPPLQRLRDVKERLAAHEVDIEKMRRESKDEWSSHLEADDT
ncbi:AbrB/MazE/SpoVT family DNA-binding domain-containing protein [Halalkaliarchaeum desulfuricum]|uniref:AbrB/MazE/SpoVT family DNA-binding domain-containing protein n=1 Tax=Halalkaliarchaeum desulfuricum TaxID=2055893 RepID=UPI000E6C7174|nr:AbrB/MazE/SpoVT family DNA-binding domain-containing protein [Halalkaliarchaeum desulfuricum]